MAIIKTSGARIARVYSRLPTKRSENLADSSAFTEEEIRKVPGLANVSGRRVAVEAICSSDIRIAADQRLLDRIEWTADSVDAVIMVTQTLDYFLPSTDCVTFAATGEDVPDTGRSGVVPMIHSETLLQRHSGQCRVRVLATTHLVRLESIPKSDFRLEMYSGDG